MVFWFSLVNLAFGAAIASFSGWHTTTLREVLLLVSIGALAALGQLLMTYSFGQGRTLFVANLQYTGVIFATLIGATVYSLVFRGLGGDDMIRDFLTSLPGGKWGALLVVQAVVFVLGFPLDFVEIVIIMVPIVGPILLQMDIDPIWLGVLFAMNLQTSFLTPPLGPTLFYLQGVVPPSVKTSDIYRGVTPFVILQVIGLALVMAFPALATWLPGKLF